MKNVMNFIKRKSTIILLIILVLLITLILILMGVFLPKTEGSVYGNRLDGIEKVPVSDELKSSIVDAISSTGHADSSEVTITGRIIKVNINVKNEVGLSDAKTIYDAFKSKFTEDILAYYDIQVRLENDNYAAFGYLKAGRTTLKWTNNK